MSQEKPLVTIIIPVFNGENYLNQAIKSALAQTYEQIEIIVINDGSVDDNKTRKIAEEFLPRIRYIELEKNLGVAAALNRGIKESRGKFISWLSHDDLYHPNKISKQIELYHTNIKDNVVIYCNYELIDNSGKSLGVNTNLIVGKEQFRFSLLNRGNLHGCSLLIPIKAFHEHGDFDESLETVQDIDMWFRISKTFEFKYLPQELVYFRIHQEQDSLVKASIAESECNVFFVKSILDLTASEIEIGSNSKPFSGYFLLINSLKTRKLNIAAQEIENFLGLKYKIYAKLRRFRFL